MIREKILLIALLCCCCFNEQGIPESDVTSGFTEGETTFSEGTSATQSGTGQVTITSDGATSLPSSSSESGESSSTEGSSDESSGTQTTSESSETGEPLPDYGPCSMAADPACEAPADTCVWTDGEADQIPPAGWCARECNSAADCPVPETGNPEIGCTYYGELPLKCVLRCPDGRTCPDGMVCLVHMFTPEYGNEYDHMCAWST